MFAGVLAASRRNHGFHCTAFCEHFAEHLKLPALGETIEFLQLEFEAQVRFVRTIAVHCFIVGQTGKGKRNIHIHGSMKDVVHHSLDYGKHVVFIDETHLYVDLGVFDLSIPPGILVAEATGNLEVLIQTGDHEQLFVDLRGLRKGVELSLVQPRGHQEIPGPFRG
ncbi:hypothetical protein ES708_30903 [subsurface metagenome]